MPLRLRLAIAACTVRERLWPCAIPPYRRCVMGSTVDPVLRCRREAYPGIWCDHHQPQETPDAR